MSIKETIKSVYYAVSNVKNKPATYLYPDKPLPVKEHSRGMLSLDLENCIGCELCYRICPSDAIRMIKLDREKAGFKNNVRNEAPAIDFNKCIFCGLCSEICPPHVLHHTHRYDISTDDRADLEYDPFRLNEVFEKVVKPNPEDYGLTGGSKADEPAKP
ncbi:MAG: NADH-quinone oxidoreductase subunit I [Candidatus Parvarchaeota archaeon]